MHPLERLVDLVALMLDSTRPLTFDQIRDRMEEAYGQSDAASAKRMFERDKDILRDVGVPIEVVATDVWDVEHGYIISKDKYYLPEIDFTPEEISALLVAARSGAEGDAAEQAVRKLLYGAEGGLLTGASAAAPLAEVGSVDARLTAAAEGIAERRSVRFGYRTARGDESERHVDPWGLVFRGGNWYLVGLDRERADVRAFRLSRMFTDPAAAEAASAPPTGFRAADHVQGGPFGPAESEERALVALSPDVAWWATKDVRGVVIERKRPDGWIEVTVPTVTGDALASWILSFGPDAEALEPISLREEIVRRLEVVLAES
ncbi:MAG: WYL domain-containing protein [Actinomycetota bacterium]